MQPPSTDREHGPLVTAAVVGAVTIGGYLALLGWDQHKTLGSDGSLHGPYEAWQVIALVGLLAAVAAWSGWRRDQGIGAMTATIALTLAWSIDAATDAENDGLWPVGAVLVAGGTVAGFLLVASLAARSRH